MDRGQITVTGRWAAVLLGAGSLTACMTPEYAVRAPGTQVAPEAQARATPAPRTHYKTGDPYQVGGIWYVPHEQPNYDQTGIASWYGDAFQMKPTADGEICGLNQFSAARTARPLPPMGEA